MTPVVMGARVASWLQSVPTDGLLAPAWVLTLATVAFMTVRAVVWIRESDEDSKRSDRDGEYRGKMLTLMQRAVEAQEEMNEESRQLRRTTERQGDLLEELTMCLENVSNGLDSHRESAHEYREKVEELHERVVE